MFSYLIRRLLGAIPLLWGILTLIFFIIRDWPPEMDEEARVAETTKRLTWSDVRVFLGDWRFWMVLIFNSAALIYLWGLNAWLPTYLLQVRHFNVRDVSIFSSLPFLLMFVGEVGAAALSDWLLRLERLRYAREPEAELGALRQQFRRLPLPDR